MQPEKGSSTPIYVAMQWKNSPEKEEEEVCHLKTTINTVFSPWVTQAVSGVNTKPQQTDNQNSSPCTSTAFFLHNLPVMGKQFVV